MHRLVMWGRSSAIISTVHSSTQPQEREINPLKTVCGCATHVAGYFNKTWFPGTWTTAKQGPYKDL